MKDFNKIVFSPQTVIWICSLAISNVITIQTLRSDIRDLATEKRLELNHIQYQIDELKNTKRPEKIALNEYHAILPNPIELKDE